MKNIKKYDDTGIINKDTYHYYANTNEDCLTLPVKGIVVEFPGLGGSSCIGGRIDMGSYCDERTKAFGEKGILVAYMFPGPWSWGNFTAVRMADAVVDALAEKYNLASGFPVASCGGSMGGTGALMYTLNSKFDICVTAAACPCVDVEACFYCHPEFPRTYISAVAMYDKNLDEALCEISPVVWVNDMPAGKYFICSDEKDELFPEVQCDLYVKKLTESGHDVEYHKQPEKKHGEFYPEVRQRLHEVIENTILA